jgi:RNA polymerase sigma-70 factor (ECF subfamily)
MAWIPVDWTWLAALAFLAVKGPGGRGDEGVAPEDNGESDPPEVIEDPDLELVLAVQAGDGAAYRGLVERYQGRVFAIIYGMVRNREDARDLAQDAFVKAFKSIGNFRRDAKFTTWLTRISMNVAIDHLRRQKLRRTEVYDEGIASRDSDGVISLSHHRHDPRRDLERKRLNARIFQALDELPEDQRQVIVLREMEGLSYREIAEIMEIPEGTVMSRLFYARKKMRDALTEEKG